jgi:hypothetical protein
LDKIWLNLHDWTIKGGGGGLNYGDLGDKKCSTWVYKYIKVYMNNIPNIFNVHMPAYYYTLCFYAKYLLVRKTLYDVHKYK